MDKLKTMQESFLYSLAIRGAFVLMDRYYQSRADARADRNLEGAAYFKRLIDETQVMIDELQELETKALVIQKKGSC